MKTFNNIIKTIFSIVILSVFLASCSEDVMDRINRDSDHTKNVPAKFILADVITSTAFHSIGGDINTYTSVYVEHEVGIHNQLYRAERRNNEPTASSTFGNYWNSVYKNLKNARIVIDKCSEGGSQEGNYVTRGMARVMAAYNSALIADMFGDAPFTEAALVDEAGLPLFMTPKVDKQEVIYQGVMDYLDGAIEDLQKQDEHLSGSAGDYDLIYSGKKELWTKFAYGLKARYTMRMLYRSTNETETLQNVLEYVRKSYDSVDEQAAFTSYDNANLNPLFDFFWSREALAASESIFDKLEERNDPRLRRVFVNAKWVQVADAAVLFLAPNGTPDEIPGYYDTSVFVYAQTAPTLFLSYHERLFLEAEALCRLGQAPLAENIVKDAVVAAIANAEIAVTAAMNAPAVLVYDGGLKETTLPVSSTEAEAYFNNEVLPLFRQEPLQETMVQKYLAFYGASGESTECYSDIRRMMALNENFIVLKNPNNTNRFPLRCPYGTSDTTANPNVQEVYGNGQYVYTEPVWWAGGSR